MIAEVQARNSLKQLQQLRAQTMQLTAHAKMLSGKASENFDSRVLLEEANSLLKNLIKSRTDLTVVVAETNTLSRALSSEPPHGGGLSTAAKWVPELRAGSKQLMVAITEAEHAIKKSSEVAKLGLNAPTRTDTDPSNLIELIVLWISFLTKTIESVQASQGKKK